MYLTSGDPALYIKTKYPGMFYAGGFVPSTSATHRLPNVNWKNYIYSLVKAGFDGTGEMTSKPVPREQHQPFNGEYYKGLWEYCESIGFPILCHVADPEEFWFEEKAPIWAKKRNWIYRENYPSKEELYTEMGTILDKYPNLKIVLAHFHFLSANLDSAANFLDKYPNTNFGLSLGIEFMYNMSRRRDDWRNFFIKYQDRILFGTDIASRQILQESLDRT